MAPPEPEWMLWAKRLRDENKILLQRIDSKPESSALQLLAEDVQSLAATVQHLQRENNTLRERMQELQRDGLRREQAVGEQVEGLGRTIAEMKKELALTADVVETMREGRLPSYHQHSRQMRTSSRPQRAAAKITYRTRAGEVQISPPSPPSSSLSFSFRIQRTCSTPHFCSSKGSFPSHDYR